MFRHCLRWASRRSHRQASPRPHSHSLGQRSFCAHGQPELRQHPHEAEGDVPTPRLAGGATDLQDIVGRAVRRR
eukprot:5173848-Lingulodinium_polyedra.AAC.1